MSNESSSNSNQSNGPSTPMTPSAAARIQSAADRAGNNAGFKGRAMAAGAKNTAQGARGNVGGKGK